jgi:molybdopterin-containing oxidoreductase family membrane subunit
MNIEYTQINGNTKSFVTVLAALGAVIGLALLSVLHMEHEGHHITGMTNQIVWGIPHVFAILLIVMASGALNIASIGTVFGRKIYKPMGRLSAFMAIALLAGGLMVLVLDLGRPDRLIVAMTMYNFKSIFAWNIILYNGFFAIVGVYLWMMMERKMNKYSHNVGMFAFVWRIILTTGTGSIFGFLVSRSMYDAAIMGPMFVIMSFSFGLAFYLLFLGATYHFTGRELGDKVFTTLRNLLGVFVAAVFYFVMVITFANLYATEHHGVMNFILTDGGIYTKLFWFGQILIGTLLPLLFLYGPKCKKSRKMAYIAAVLILLGAFAQLYIIIIGGQAYPMQLFPGMEVSSSFFDGVVNNYSPTFNEVMLGLGGISTTILLIVVGLAALPLLPKSLSDKDVNPHS